METILSNLPVSIEVLLYSISAYLLIPVLIFAVAFFFAVVFGVAIFFFRK